MREGWGRSRLFVYATVLMATFVAGWIPWLAGVVTAVALIVANIVLVRRPMQWLPPFRRTFSRLVVRVWMLLLIVATFTMNTLAAPLIAAVGFGAVISAITGLVATFLYIEGALLVVERGVQATQTTAA